MKLTPEQTQTIATWIAAGDSLSDVQKKLAEQFKISMTYRDVRFLVDDLNLELKNAAPTADASDVTKSPPPPAAEPLPDESGQPDEHYADDGALPPEEMPADDGLPSNITVDIDRIVRPGAAMSGSVTFSDGVAGKWALDQYGRLMLDTGTPGYQPSPGDVKAFQKELQSQLQRQGY